LVKNTGSSSREKEEINGVAGMDPGKPRAFMVDSLRDSWLSFRRAVHHCVVDSPRKIKAAPTID